MTRTRPRTNGSLALKLDFGLTTLPRRDLVPPGGLRLAQRPYTRDKYTVLEHRRRQAQIAARRLLELTEGN
jgi:hypothetical protein